MSAAGGDGPGTVFDACRAQLEALIGFLGGGVAASMSHFELEQRVGLDGREVLRLALQGHLDLRAGSEVRIGCVTDAGGVARSSVEAGHERALATVFGEVRVRRLAYRARGHPNLHPADGALNLPAERHSHGLRELAAIEAARGSFEDAVDAIGRSTGTHVAKRQVEALAQAAAADFDAFYARAATADVIDTGEAAVVVDTEPDERADVVVLSCDGKGIVMRPDALRPTTAKAASKTKPKLATRLSKGEKLGRKRMAEVGAVYEIKPVPRTPADIMTSTGEEAPPPAQAPKANNKWVMASVALPAATVVARVFDQAQARDPTHQRPWVALVDGNNHQIHRIKAEADARNLTVPIVIDFIHVLEYLWRAAWCFFNEGDTAAETWVRDKSTAVLNGQASTVAASVRRKATCLRLDPAKRANADTCADYLLRKRPYLDYPTALQKGWPIATGVIEGACRHLVKDRMDITGARWSVNGAEAILKLRALLTNQDFPAYWHFHLTQEHQRIHATHYANGLIPQAA